MTGACYRCGHPFASHDFTDDEPGPCYHDRTPLGAGCAWGCDTYQDPDHDPSDAELEAAGMIGDGGGPSAREATRAAWRQHEETHR